MERIPVSSSNIASVGYEPTSRVLEIEFHNSGVYEYFDVPPHVYDGLLQAPSKGRYHHRHIRDVYRYRRIS